MAKKQLSDDEKKQRAVARARNKEEKEFQERMRKAWHKAGRPAGNFEFEGRSTPFMFGGDEMKPHDLKVQNIEPTKSDVRELQAKATALYHADETSALMLGIALEAVRKVMPKRTFFTWWKDEKGWTQARVSYCLRVAQGKNKKAPLAGRKRTGNAQAKSFITRTTALFATAFDFSTMYQPERELMRNGLAETIEHCQKLTKALNAAPPAVVPVVAAKKSNAGAAAGQ